MTQRTCTLDGCGNPHFAKGMCKPHYRRDYYLRNKERENANFKAYREANLEREKARWAEYAEARWGAERATRAEARFRRLGATSKKCTRCSADKPKSAFYKDDRRVDGLYSWCKSCFGSHSRSVYDPARASRLWVKFYATEEGRRATAERQRRWYAANPERAREQVRRYQARKLAATVEKVDYPKILERDGMVCHLCRGEIASLDDLHFDHVIPLVRGGEHSMSNIKPAHAACNLRKSDKLIEELDWLASA